MLASFVAMERTIFPINLPLAKLPGDFYNDHDLLRYLAFEMIEELPTAIEALEDAIDENCAERAKYMCVNIGWIAANFQAKKLMTLAALMESKYSNLTEAERDRLVGEMVIECERMTLEVRCELDML